MSFAQIGLPCSDGTLAMTEFDFYRTLLLEPEREESQTTNPRSSWLCLILPQRLPLTPCSAYEKGAHPCHQACACFLPTGFSHHSSPRKSPCFLCLSNSYVALKAHLTS